MCETHDNAKPKDHYESQTSADIKTSIQDLPVIKMAKAKKMIVSKIHNNNIPVVGEILCVRLSCFARNMLTGPERGSSGPLHGHTI